MTEVSPILQKLIGCDGEALTRGRSGCVLHFQRMAKQGFFDQHDRRRSVTLDELQVVFDAWLLDYNQGAELLGYPTMGKSPLQMIAIARATMVRTSGVSAADADRML